MTHFSPMTTHYNQRRASMLVIHGIGTSLAEAERILTGQTEYEASAHYLVTQTGEVRQYLDEDARAWHAGKSYWVGCTDINSLSIGIELEHMPVIHDEKDFHLVFYTDVQLKALAALAMGIMERHQIAPAMVLAHQDIAPYRKTDPGINFDWAGFAAHGIGLWHGHCDTGDDMIISDTAAIALFKSRLALFGYDPRVQGDGVKDDAVIRAFQTHFLPWHVCGQVTLQSIAALDNLLTQKFA